MMKKIKLFFKGNYFNFIWLFLVLIFLLIIKEYPYFNLIFNDQVIAIIIFILVVLFFSIKAEVLFKLAIFLLLPSLILTLLNFSTASEAIGELIYFLLFLGFIKKLNDISRLV